MFHYGFDLLEAMREWRTGNGPAPSWIAALVKRLPDTSMTAASLAGGREYFGWGVDRYIAASTYDGLMLNTRTTGNFKKPPDFPLWPKPGDVKKTRKPDRPASVLDIFRMFDPKKVRG